jgi:hypothetical protein
MTFGLNGIEKAVIASFTSNMPLTKRPSEAMPATIARMCATRLARVHRFVLGPGRTKGGSHEIFFEFCTPRFK